jgi:hypothetical protein
LPAEIFSPLPSHIEPRFARDRDAAVTLRWQSHTEIEPPYEEYYTYHACRHASHTFSFVDDDVDAWLSHMTVADDMTYWACTVI